MGVRVFLAIGLCVCVAGCDATTGPVASVPTNPAQVLPTGSMQGLPMPDAPSVTAASAATEYRIAPQDVLDVSVYQVPALSRTVLVDAAGQIDLPLLGRTPAAGKTSQELETLLAQRLGAKYLQSPQVSVVLKDSVAQRVTVDGAITQPGVYPIRGTTTLMQMLAQSKGLTDVGDPSGIMVFRMVGGQKVAAKFDISAIRAGTTPDPQIFGGDSIVVDESGPRSAWKVVRDVLPTAGYARVLVP